MFVRLSSSYSLVNFNIRYIYFYLNEAGVEYITRYIIHFAIILHESSFSPAFVNLTLTLKLSLKVNLVPYQKSWDTKPINCVGVQTFEHSELKFTNVRMLKFHIRLCSTINMLFLKP